ncbi:ATPase-like protein [Novymonas esmeraldas]|uniref:ATPase-like protein n=1 Tax=Novymonas esmeraldas TaxID=1808958 RepID=A0AAW0EKX1_9TRYP
MPLHSTDGAAVRASAVFEVHTTADAACWPELSSLVRSYVRVQASRRLSAGHHPPFLPGAAVSLADAPQMLTDDVVSIRVCDVSLPTGCDWTRLEQMEFCMRLYCLHGESRRPCASSSAAALHQHAQAPPTWCVADDGGGSDDSVPAFTCTPLPHRVLEGQWESLYYGESEAASIAFKRDLVCYVDAAMRVSRAGVDSNLVSWNRLLLFHGPPGTGKTSLCRALSQKLAIRLASSAYPRAYLVEINAHSLFSRWFSESGKRVLQLFEQVHRIADDADCLVCCVMDEVESLAAARASAMKGNEPSDSIRAVNALLTQVDRLQACSNILVLTTSNLTCAIDAALLDRADKRVYVGPPGMEARFLVLQASVHELIAKGLVAAPRVGDESRSDEPPPHHRGGTPPPLRDAATAALALMDEEVGVSHDVAHSADGPPPPPSLSSSSSAPGTAPPIAHAAHRAAGLRSGSSATAHPLSSLLRHIAEVCAGLNGRTLKKLPFLAYSACLCSGGGGDDEPVQLHDYLEALYTAAHDAVAALELPTSGAA